MSNDTIPSELLSALLSAPIDRRKAALDILLGHTQPNQSTSPTGPLLLGMDAGAKFIGISRSSLWRLIKSGRITPVEFRPGSYKVRRADLEQLARAGL